MADPVSEGAGAARRTPRDELVDETAHGELYLARLRHAQLSLSILALVAFGGLLGSLPLVLAVVPGLTHIHVIGVPLSVWLVAGPLFPLFVALAAAYRRRADALDESFRELVHDE